MTRVANGTFVVEIKPQGDVSSSDGLNLGRMIFKKKFEGGLVGIGRGEMLTARTPVDGSAAYVAMERVSGSLHGRTGGFVLQHAGTMNGGAQLLSISIVPDSGTGELSGIAGAVKLRVEGEKHYYELEYTLPG
jgi:hypothetical protein